MGAHVYYAIRSCACQIHVLVMPNQSRNHTILDEVIMSDRIYAIMYGRYAYYNEAVCVADAIIAFAQPLVPPVLAALFPYSTLPSPIVLQQSVQHK